MPKKRRNFDAEFKTRVVLELLSKATQVFEQPQDLQEKEARIAELERMVGKLTMKVELQKKVLNLGDTRSRSDE